MTNISWTLVNNLQSVFTSCGGRGEREGYFFDEHVLSQTACFDVDMSSFLTKWIRDMRDAQYNLRSSDGAYTMYAPQDGLSHPQPGEDDTGCQIGGLIFPWRLYQNYADRRILAEHYDSANRWFTYLTNRCMRANGTWIATNWGYNYPQIELTVTDWMEGDHYRINGTGPSDWANGSPAATATWETWGNSWSAHSADILGAISKVLQAQALSIGQSSNVTYYSNKYTHFTNVGAKIRDAFLQDIVKLDGGGEVTHFLSIFHVPSIPEWHSVSQSDSVAALHFDMLPASLRPNAHTNMLIGGPATNGYWGISNYNKYCSDGSKCTNHLSTGYAMSVRAMLELTRRGFTTNAYRLLTNLEFPFGFTLSLTDLQPVGRGGTHTFPVPVVATATTASTRCALLTMLP